MEVRFRCRLFVLEFRLSLLSFAGHRVLVRSRSSVAAVCGLVVSVAYALPSEAFDGDSGVLAALLRWDAAVWSFPLTSNFSSNRWLWLVRLQYRSTKCRCITIKTIL
ncbi:unnamed protein product [Lathyrus oleraceus]